VDGYKVTSYITNLSTGERVPYNSLTKEQKIEAEKKMIYQMVNAIGYSVKSMKPTKNQ
jgi:hypothetical protein